MADLRDAPFSLLSIQVNVSSYSDDEDDPRTDDEILQTSEHASMVILGYLRDAKQELLDLGMNLNWGEPGVGG